LCGGIAARFSFALPARGREAPPFPSGQLPEVVADRSIEDAIARADDALHIAKTNGPNQAIVNL
jgi:hypothetical protein